VGRWRSESWGREGVVVQSADIMSQLIIKIWKWLGREPRKKNTRINFIV
jgi:hypothetical protein